MDQQFLTMSVMLELTHVRRAAAAVGVCLFLALPSDTMAQKPAQPAGDGVADRVTQIEEQMVDLQVVIGTLQSLVQKGAVAADGSSPGMVAAPGAGDLGARVQVIETQIQALTGQIEHLTQQLSALSTRLGDGAVTTPSREPPGGPSGFVTTTPAPAAPQPPAFGTTTVVPAERPTARPAPVETAPLEPPSGNQVAAVKAKAMYEDAYGHLLRRDYGAAEAGFVAFLSAYPQDALSGQAQYWLGETYYVRGKYDQAANTFLQGYKRYKSSKMAPDNLLRLGMALQQLGEKDAACATFSELLQKFPKAPAHLKKRAKSEQKRSDCG